MPTAESSLAWKTSLRKVRTLWHCSRLRSVALYHDWSWWYRQAIDRCSNIWASLPGAGYGQFEHKADSLIAKFKEAGGTVREIDVWVESPRLSPSGYLHHRLPVMGCNHYRDNAITYKAQRDKNARNSSWRTRQLLTCRCVSVMLLRSMQNTRRS